MPENNKELSELLQRLKQSVEMYDSARDASDACTQENAVADNADATDEKIDYNVDYITDKEDKSPEEYETDEHIDYNVDNETDKTANKNTDVYESADENEDEGEYEITDEDVGESTKGISKNTYENTYGKANDASSQSYNSHHGVQPPNDGISVRNITGMDSSSDSDKTKTEKQDRPETEFSDDFTNRLADRLADILESRLYDKNSYNKDVGNVGNGTEASGDTSPHIADGKEEGKNVDAPVDTAENTNAMNPQKVQSDLPRFRYRDGLFGEAKSFVATEREKENDIESKVENKVKNSMDSDTTTGTYETNIVKTSDTFAATSSKPKNMIKVFSKKDELYESILSDGFARGSSSDLRNDSNDASDDEDYIFSIRRSDMNRPDVKTGLMQNDNKTQNVTGKESSEQDKNNSSDFSVLDDEDIITSNDVNYDDVTGDGLSERKTGRTEDASDDADYSAASDADNIEFGIAVPEKRVTAADIGDISITSHRNDKKHGDSSAKTKKGEYSSNSQNTAVYNEFKRRKISVTVRLITAIFFTIVMFFEENFAIFCRVLGRVPSSLLDVLLLVFIGALTVPELKCGIMPLKKGKANPATLMLLGFSVAFIYDLTVLAFSHEYILMYGLTLALGSDLLIFNTLLGIFAAECSFAVISSSGDKLVCDICATTEKEMESGVGREAVRIKKTGFVDGFMKNLARPQRESRFDLIITTVAFVLSLIIPCVYGAVNGFTFTNFMTCASLSFSLLLAVGFICSRAYSVFCISKRASEAGSAIIGDGAVSDYSEVKDILFEDVEAFPSSLVKVVKIKLTSDSVLNRVLYYVAGVFRCVGGPLESVFGVASGELGTPEDVSVADVSDLGITACVDGVPVCVGKKDYLIDIGYAIPDDGEDERRTKAGPVSILYVAAEGKYCGKFYIQYGFDRNFARRVADMNKYGIRTHIRTFDSNIDDEMLKKTIKLDKNTISVVKKNRREIMDFGSPKVESSLITKYTAAQLIKIITLTKKVKRLSVLAGALKLLSIFGGICISLAFIRYPILLGTLSSAYALLYQAFFGLLTALVTKIELK